MKRLAHVSLEGLLQQGPQQVWITLGTYPTFELAEQAAADPHLRRPGIVSTRLVPLYRVSDLPAEAVLPPRKPHSHRPSAPDSVTVA